MSNRIYFQLLYLTSAAVPGLTFFKCPAESKALTVYAMGSLEETKVWLHFAKDCMYLSPEVFDSFEKRFDELGAKIYKLYENWKTL